jgi:hypothetical protein
MLANDMITALIAAVNAAPGLTGVSIIDGPRLVTDQSTASVDRLFIGASDTGDNVAAEGSNDPQSGILGVIDSDLFALICTAEAWSGDTDPASRRARVFTLLQEVRTLLRPDAQGVTLGLKALSSARLGAWQLIQAQGTRGFYAGIVFRIECVAAPSTV